MNIHQILHQYWGYTQFRSLQENVIQEVMMGNDVLALMPTGGGKSICFQVPALAKPGMCLVISPLIALMKDQVDNLVQRGIAAQAIFSGMKKVEIAQVMDDALQGRLKFLYLSPERILSKSILQSIGKMEINLIAVDEAHCISQWGYDFRPPYLRIHEIRNLLPQTPILALTATATQQVRKDILHYLKLKNPQTLIKSFFRKNLAYVVALQEDKLGKLLKIASQIQGTGIVYVRTRRETVNISEFLNRNGIIAEHYHAGLELRDRAERQYRWKNNDTRIVVATNAFGMGIDKEDVRFVVHLNFPDSLEAYYQEAGRAGRDEKKAFAVLLSNTADIKDFNERILHAFPTLEELKACYNALGNHFQIATGVGAGLSFDFDLLAFCRKFDFQPVKTLNCVKFLAQSGYITYNDAVLLPSKLKINMNFNFLHRFQTENLTFEPLIKTLLRSYANIFDQYVIINENDLANRADISVNELLDMFKYLELRNVLIYLPQTEMPQLTFLENRVEAQYMQLNHQFIAERKKVFLSQMQGMKDYVSKNKCRSVQILNYFDEHEAVKCGTCDVCLEEKRKLNSSERYAQMVLEITQIINNQNVSIKELQILMPKFREKEIIETVRLLLDAEKLKLKGDKLHLH